MSWVVVLDGVRWPLCNPTHSDTFGITLDPNVASFSPLRAPRVLYYPVVNTSLCTVSNNSSNVVSYYPTWSGEYALKIEFENRKGLDLSNIYLFYLPITSLQHFSVCLNNFKRLIAKFKVSVDMRLYYRYLYPVTCITI